MAAISLLGFSLPQGLILSKSVNSNMASSVLLDNSNNKQDSITNSSKTFSKITVQNVLGENNGNSINISNNLVSSHTSSASVNNNNTIVRKIKDFGMAGAVNNVSGNSSLNASSTTKNLIVRKRPLTETKNILNESNKPITPVIKKPKQTKESTTPKTAKKSANENVQKLKKSTVLQVQGAGTNNINPKPAGTPGRKGLPLPQAVARRNARERNRVKQVNNGFAALRERIPEEVAEAFESQGSGRGSSAKKLSKVETLRMAVEYIRSLERLLGFDFSGQQGSFSSGEESYTLIKDEFDTLSPSIDENFDDSMSNYDMDDYFSTTSNNNNNNNNNNDVSQAEQISNPIDLLPDITTLNGLQYIRIPGTNTYQLLTPDIFVGTTHSPPNSSLDDEQFNALIDSNCLSSTTTAVGLTTSPINANQTTSSTTTANSIISTTPASPTIVTTTATTTVTTATTQNGECVSNVLPQLSPVPQMQQTTSSSSLSSSSSISSPDAGSSSSLYQANKPATISPANVAVNEHHTLTQTCATATVMRNIQRQFIAPTLPHLLPHFIKQEYAGDQVDFASTAESPIVGNSFQITAAGDQQHATHSLSPPLDRCNRLLIAAHHTNMVELPSFYEQDDSSSFYDNNLDFNKKDLNDVLLDASTVTNTGLSDESMIEAIDWWEAHTPQSEGGVNAGAVML